MNTDDCARKPRIRKVQGTLCMMWLALKPRGILTSKEYSLWQSALRFTYRENRKHMQELGIVKCTYRGLSGEA